MRVSKADDEGSGEITSSPEVVTTTAPPLLPLHREVPGSKVFPFSGLSLLSLFKGSKDRRGEAK